MRRTCFVISPIGQDGTQVRTDADAFLQYLVEPALEKFNFDVVRADKIPRPTVITADIIRLVQESDLCIIDITSSNANVFYECGRRHETGRPFLQMIKAGETSTIPFDVGGIRTIEYDLSTVAQARASIKQLQLFIDEIVKSDFGTKGAGYTMASIGEAIDRIDRKITRSLEERSGLFASSKRKSASKLDLITSHPREAFESLMESGDFGTAFTMLPRLRAVMSPHRYADSVGLLARAGDVAGRDHLNELIDLTLKDEPIDDAVVRSAAYSIKEFFVNTGKPKDGIQALEAIYEKASASGGLDSGCVGAIANMIGMAAWVANEHAVGQKYEELAVTLCPTVPAYWFNKALTHQRLKEDSKLATSLRSLAKCSPLNDSHKELLAKHGVDVAA